MFKYIVVYYNPNRKEYYYKVVKYANYDPGYENSYGHKVILTINVMDIWYPPKISIREKLLKRAISFLENKLKKLKNRERG